MMNRGLRPISRMDWDHARARHLLNRAGFGVPADRIDQLESMSPEDAVDWFVDDEARPQNLVDPDLRIPSEEEQAIQAEMRRRSRRLISNPSLSDSEKQKLQAEIRQQQNRIRREQRQSIEDLKAWWLQRMIQTPRPLEEKMTLFWHGHFATSAEKVRSPRANYDLNSLFRSAATGNFKLLTYEVGCSPAMMLYLDNARSRKEHPNENWARELMELYTLGQGHYSEEDIKNAARAFTGWSTDGESFVYRPGIHDDGPKTFMGHQGNLNGQDIIDIIFDRPDTAEFISTKLWEYFAYENPDPPLRRALAQTLYENGYELKPFLRKVFLSEAFYSEKAMGTRIKSPAELVISLIDAIGVEAEPLVEKYLIFAMGRMGQNLFYPPNVKGWPGGRTWISAGTLMSRYNLSSFLVHGVISEVTPEVRRAVMKRYRGNREFRRGLALRRLREKAREEAAQESMEMGMSDMNGPSPSGPLGLQLPDTPANVRTFFVPYDHMDCEAIVRSIADALYVRPLRTEQINQMTEVLAGDSESRVFSVLDWPEEQLQDALHLMTSAAEFQLC